MKRFVFLTGAASLVALATPADANAEPGILYIPTETISLVPTDQCPVPQGGQANSGLGCGGVTDPGDIAPYDGDMDALMTGLNDALSAYDVMITNTRPPEYVSYFMLMPSSMESTDSMDHDCVGAVVNCGGHQRDDIGFTNGGTMNCMSPDPLAEALYAFGRMSGLEGTDDMTGAMFYPPDYTMPATAYSTTCANRVQQIGYDDMDNQITLPLECTTLDHEPCDMSGQQNSDADLMAWYGARADDTAAPELSNIVPADGDMLDSGAALTMDVDIKDDDQWVNVRWVVTSMALENAGVEGGILDQCTNNACQGAWKDAMPLKATDSDWAFTVNGPPDGDYVITLEASDFHGNVADLVTINVTVGNGSSGGTGADGGTGGADTATSGADGGADSSAFTSGGASGTGTGGGDSAGGGGGDGSSSGGGCKIEANPTNGAFGLLLIGLFVLGLRHKED